MTKDFDSYHTTKYSKQKAYGARSVKICTGNEKNAYQLREGAQNEENTSKYTKGASDALQPTKFKVEIIKKKQQPTKIKVDVIKARSNLMGESTQ